ncbi:rhomboid family intramembrane serine protease [Flavobacteriaceae bacterium F08102]|nr:rhomboid family intramembrane serine protease [Flavobacteriaceae bacterium F08102]
MTAWIHNITQKFKKANTVEQLIYINIIVFALSYLVESFGTLMGAEQSFFFKWFALPAELDSFMTRPWSILSYGFLHGDFLHILFNLILLFYIGNLFLDFFSRKQFYLYYGLGITVGGIFYLLSYSFFPALQGAQGILVGASAGVSAILVGLATKIPNYAIHLRFIGPVKLWYIAVAFVVIDLMQLPINNTGGHIAHLGGACMGYLLSSVSIQPSTRRNKNKKAKSPLRTVFKNERKTTTTSKQQRIDAILDKISKSGYEALSKEEKDFLFSIHKTPTDSE